MYLKIKNLTIYSNSNINGKEVKGNSSDIGIRLLVILRQKWQVN